MNLQEMEYTMNMKCRLKNVLNALPDFILPHYGNVIVEHLGLLNDAEYLRKWTKKRSNTRLKGFYI